MYFIFDDGRSRLRVAVQTMYESNMVIDTIVRRTGLNGCFNRVA
jgi:hypothetical protein